MFNDECWNEISSNAKDFISNCLIFEYKKRPSVRTLLDHILMKDIIYKHHNPEDTK